MKTKHKNIKPAVIKEPAYNADPTSPDNDADKTGTDVSSDKTQPGTKEKGKHATKFDKPKREPNPDCTSTDTDSDKTKKENSPVKAPAKAGASKPTIKNN